MILGLWTIESAKFSMKKIHFRFIASLIATLVLFGTAAVIGIAFDEISRFMMFFTFRPSQYFFVVWPIIVLAGNTNAKYLRLSAKLATLAYFFFMLDIDPRGFEYILEAYGSVIFKYSSQADLVEIVLFALWCFSFISIQYFIWFPIKAKKDESSFE
jgi:hypothetical protein